MIPETEYMIFLQMIWAWFAHIVVNDNRGFGIDCIRSILGVYLFYYGFIKK